MAAMISQDIGGRLRQAREQRGWSLQDAARVTKLTTSVLRAIERNDFASLPEGMYRKAYVRTLAAAVGLDPSEIVTEYCAWYEPRVEAPGPPTRGAVIRDKWIEELTPSRRRWLATLALLVMLSTAWLWLQPTLVQPRAHVGAAVGQPPVVVRTVRESASTRTVGRVSPDAIRAATVDQPHHVPLRIELAATGWCWVAAESDGERVLYRLVEPGEQMILEGEYRISLRLGDAGAVTLSINDGSRHSPGGDGEVVEVEVTPDTVESLRTAAIDAVDRS
jgi:transcriptional regulator with XRE-family HTH domain